MTRKQEAKFFLGNLREGARRDALKKCAQTREHFRDARPALPTSWKGEILVYSFINVGTNEENILSKVEPDLWFSDYLFLFKHFLQSLHIYKYGYTG